MKKILNWLLGTFSLILLSGFATFFIAVFKPEGVAQALEIFKNLFGG